MAALHQTSNKQPQIKRPPDGDEGPFLYPHLLIHTAGQPLAMLAGAAGCASLGVGSRGEMVAWGNGRPGGIRTPNQGVMSALL